MTILNYRGTNDLEKIGDTKENYIRVIDKRTGTSKVYIRDSKIWPLTSVEIYRDPDRNVYVVVDNTTHKRTEHQEDQFDIEFDPEAERFLKDPGGDQISKFELVRSLYFRNIEDKNKHPKKD